MNSGLGRTGRMGYELRFSTSSIEVVPQMPQAEVVATERTGSDGEVIVAPVSTSMVLYVL